MGVGKRDAAGGETGEVGGVDPVAAVGREHAAVEGVDIAITAFMRTTSMRRPGDSGARTQYTMRARAGNRAQPTGSLEARQRRVGEAGADFAVAVAGEDGAVGAAA